MRRYPALIAVAFAGALGAASSPVDARSGWVVESKVLGIAPAGDGLMALVTANGHVAYVERADSGTRVVHDGHRGKWVDGVLNNTLVLSPDGAHVSYGALAEGNEVIVRDDAFSPRVQSLGSLPVWSGSSEHLLYAMQRDSKWFVVRDDSVGPPWEAVGNGSLRFAPTGDRFAYAASRAGRWCVVVDGVSSESHEAVGREGPIFDVSGKHVAFEAQDGGKSRLVRDGVPGNAWDAIGDISFSPDGSHLAYQAFEDKTWRVVLDTLAGQGTPTLRRQSLIISPDGRHYACVAGDRKHGWRVIHDGRIGPEFADIPASSLVFGRDSEHLAYSARARDGWVVVIDERQSPGYKELAPPGPAFSADGSHTAYGAYEGGAWHVVVDGRPGPGFARLASPVRFEGSATTPSWFAKRGSSWAYYREGVPEVDLDDVDSKSMVRSPDGRHVAYIASRGPYWFVVSDGQPGPEFEGIFSGLGFARNPVRLGYIARRGAELIEVTHTLVSPD